MPVDYIEVPLSTEILTELRAQATENSQPLDAILADLVDTLMPSIDFHLNPTATI